jgi:hypothetical protein
MTKRNIIKMRKYHLQRICTDFCKKPDIEIYYALESLIFIPEYLGLVKTVIKKCLSS